jgi:hypothetical protein
VPPSSEPSIKLCKEEEEEEEAEVAVEMHRKSL